MAVLKFQPPGSRPDAGPGDAAFVEYRDVCKTYDGQALAVDNLNCQVRRGEFLTFLGPSGSGKTTALMMLAGFEPPSSGDILVKGASMSRTPPHLRNMGVVFQSYALFPHMTVAENIGFPLSVRGLPRDEIRNRVVRALDLVRLSGLGKRRINEISGGQQQRVALARALIFDPDLVLMDEPLGALDKQLREQLQLEIKAIQRRLGVTVIYVTHDQSEALTMSDRIAVFDQGKIQQMAAPQELYDQPASAFVAQFVGENNRIDGSVAVRQGENCVVSTDGGLAIHATPVEPLSPGDGVTLSIRPERIVLRPEFGAGPNAFSARVDELIYQGDCTRIRLSLPGGLQIFAKTSLGPGSVEARPGDVVRVGWRAEDCRAFPTEPGGGPRAAAAAEG